MEQLCLIISSICISTVLGLTSPGVVVFTHFPVELTIHSGATAEFTCNISSLNYNPGDINWYKADNEQKKIADLKTSENDRTYISTFWELRKAVLYIKNVTLSDSGKYFCGLINVTADDKFMKSNNSTLNVTDAQTRLILTQTTPWKVDRKDGKSNVLKNPIIRAAVILALLMLLVIFMAVFLMWYKKRNKTPQPQVKHLGSPPIDPAVYTVDYGVLDFQNNPYRKSAEMCVTEQVEYATITFPQGKPSMGEHSRRDAA